MGYFFLRDAHRKSFVRRSTFSQDRGCRIADPSHTDVMAYHAQRTNCILLNAGIGTCLLILASSSCGAPPTEMNFHLLASSYVVERRQLSSLTCQHDINPFPNTLPLNGSRGLRVHPRLAAEFVDYPHARG